jgi:hypothetical protein
MEQLTAPQGGLTLRCTRRGFAARQLAAFFSRRLDQQPFWTIIAAPMNSIVNQTSWFRL